MAGGDIEQNVPLITSSGKEYTQMMIEDVSRGFIRKVYGILACQLFVTFGFVLFVTLNPAAQHFVEKSVVFFVMSLV